jgi:superfamily II DNA or RNA helicase
LIVEDVLHAIQENRKCLVLSDRRTHCQSLLQELSDRGKNAILLDGGLPKKEREVTFKTVREIPDDRELAIVATSSLVGEGFDCPQVDTLFLTFPVAFRGRLVQYVGRAMRSYPGKHNVRVYDYVDDRVPVLSKMAQKRRKAYETLGFEVHES